jgi:predicted O-methyltransferase YrrM
VTTVERSADKARMAAGNFARGGLAPVIDLVQEDAAVVLSRLADASVDFVFLDAERAEYPGWWRDLTRVLRPGGLLVADNAVSHAGEMARFRELLSDDRRFTACIVPVGNGELLAVKGSPGDPEVLEE